MLVLFVKSLEGAALKHVAAEYGFLKHSSTHMQTCRHFDILEICKIIFENKMPTIYTRFQIPDFGPQDHIRGHFDWLRSLGI